MKRITVKLIGENGNVFNLIAIVRKALIKNGMINESKEFVSKAMGCQSYDELLGLIQEYVDVE